MDEIGLFPLGIVLLPSEQVPLHIFEPRYRELIAQCLEQERGFGVVFADEDGLRAIGTRAAVTEVLERFDDGRLNIVVEGGERFRLVEVNEGNSFHTGEIEPVVDELDPADEDAKERALALFRRLVELTGSDVGEPEAPSSSRSRASIVRANVVTPFNIILTALGVVTLIFGDWRDALFLGIVVTNAGIGIFQELRAKNTLDELAALVAPQATVVR